MPSPITLLYGSCTVALSTTPSPCLEREPAACRTLVKNTHRHIEDMMLLNKTHMNLINQNACLTPNIPHYLSPVLSEVDSLCAELLSSGGCGFDPSPAMTRAITNVVCTLVFSATYCHGDAELQEVLQYNDGIVQTIARGGLVDIYPWMKVHPAVSSCCFHDILLLSLCLSGLSQQDSE